MTCPLRIKSEGHRGGFTLVEIIVVLMILGVVVGGSLAAMLANSSERKLQNASGDIELLAKQARTASILNQTPYAIEFHSGFLRLVPLSKPSESDLATHRGDPVGGESSQEHTRHPVHREITIDPDISLFVRRWNTPDFIAPRGTVVPVWRFDPDGLSEPLTVRLSLGDNYVMDTYHPLTAAIADTESQIY